MHVEVRVYKRYDTDLLALHDAGYSLSLMMKDALTAYANGVPFRIFIENPVDMDLNDKKTIRVRINLPDPSACALIKQIKHGLRSNFCKQILRNAFLQQNLACYYSDPTYISMHLKDRDSLQPAAMQRAAPCERYRLTKQMTIQPSVLPGVSIPAGSMTTAPYPQAYAIPQAPPMQAPPMQASQMQAPVPQTPIPQTVPQTQMPQAPPVPQEPAPAVPQADPGEIQEEDTGSTVVQAEETDAASRQMQNMAPTLADDDEVMDAFNSLF